MSLKTHFLKLVFNHSESFVNFTLYAVVGIKPFVSTQQIKLKVVQKKRKKRWSVPSDILKLRQQPFPNLNYTKRHTMALKASRVIVLVCSGENVVIMSEPVSSE